MPPSSRHDCLLRAYVGDVTFTIALFETMAGLHGHPACGQATTVRRGKTWSNGAADRSCSGVCSVLAPQALSPRPPSWSSVPVSTPRDKRSPRPRGRDIMQRNLSRAACCYTWQPQSSQQSAIVSETCGPFRLALDARSCSCTPCATECCLASPPARLSDARCCVLGSNHSHASQRGTPPPA